jgi:hypothetical protein
MIEFPAMQDVKEPRPAKMSLAEYIRYCDFCLKNNPHVTPENCLHRKTGEESIKEPFSL